ncbi:MAG: beta-ketoacyl-ACP synthase III [Proteobacteria bacterium]|nr:beta-ketoacyl-ACP synthase III [Pseudomonadota bacterium]
MEAYITDISSFLPNAPVGNDQMEEILGMVNQLPSRTRKIILRNNKIDTRYYAIDPATGKITHTNAQLAAEAIRKLNPHDNFSINEIKCLCCGTSSPDQLMPGHASMVHGELGSNPCEIVSTAGICLSGLTSLKYAVMNVALGLTENAVACGSENSSTFMRTQFCGAVDKKKAEELPKQPQLGFDADFLRWMLSDGAGALFVAGKKPADKLALKVDWIEILSFANLFETCMYAGANKNEDGSLTGWREHSSLQESLNTGTFLVKQDVKLLNQEIMPASTHRALAKLIEKYNLKPEEIDWFLPHYSSDYFRKILYQHLEKIDFTIPYEKWFTNLYEMGNTGAASIFIIMEGLFKSGKLKKGDKLLCYIPESGRFSIGYVMLTVV